MLNSMITLTKISTGIDFN